MVIRKSLYILFRNLLGGVLLALLLIILLMVLKHYISSTLILSHWQVLLIDLSVFALPIVLALFMLIYSLVNWGAESHTIEKDHIVCKSGIFNIREANYSIKQIDSVVIKQNFLEKIFNSGSIELKIKKSKENILLRNVLDPETLVTYLRKYTVNTSSKGFSKLSLVEILKKEEDETTEFKSSFRWDYKQGKVNKELEKTIMKTIVGFLNGSGGTLVIGVDDNKKPLGLEADYQTLQKKNNDGFVNHFTQVFSHWIGLEYRNLVRIKFQKSESEDICIIYVKASNVPIYLKENEHSEFYLRTGNSINLLDVEKATTYINLHWSK
ncbi:MAG TPA: putative DNA binding domain-containing protein [Niabella sp.]|nr:putative DNA binding domain-containing protein [Niabella sp.]